MAKLTQQAAQKVAEVLKAVAHPERLRIVEILENGEKCVNEIVTCLEGKQSITSQQLNMMKDKGVLQCRRDGAKVYYRIANENVIRVLHCVYDHCDNNER